MSISTRNSQSPIAPAPPGPIGCPSTSALARHLAGTGDRSIEDHLATCRRCRQLENVVHTAISAFAKRKP